MIIGPDGRRISKSVKRDSNAQKKSPPEEPKEQATSASRAQVQVYLETCERLEEELEVLKASQNINVEKLK